MTTIELIADACARSAQWMKMTLGDFSEADMLVRPVPAANHTAWQMGHMLAGEVFMVNMIAPGTMPTLPPAFFKLHEDPKASSKVDDPKAFPSKEQLFKLLDEVRGTTVKWIKTLTPEQLAQATAEKMKEYAPTVMHLVLLLMSHTSMHAGQMQVIRRKLGKPILF
jgi:uncharacterized damage-inducible protein DinB